MAGMCGSVVALYQSPWGSLHSKSMVLLEGNSNESRYSYFRASASICAEECRSGGLSLYAATALQPHLSIKKRINSPLIGDKPLGPVIKNGRVGISYSEDFNKESIRFAIDQACQSNT